MLDCEEEGGKVNLRLTHGKRETERYSTCGGEDQNSDGFNDDLGGHTVKV